MKNARRRVFLLQIGGILLALICAIWIRHTLPVTDALAAIQQSVMQWGVWSAICYPLLYACCNVLLLPGGILSIGGGFFFGLWWGFLIVLVGNVGGAALSFFLSRLAGRSWLGKKLLRTSAYEALEPAVRREGWKIILLSQLNPLFPTSLLNYLYGLTTIRFRTCMLWVAIGQAPGLFLYAYLGTLGQLGLNLFRGKTHPHIVEYFIWGIGLVSLAMLVVVMGRVARRLLEQAERDAGEKSNQRRTSNPVFES